MSAFGPFKTKVEIPFDEFGNSGLFLVTGDTGAGKTTIFDAISFALFGNASGENRTTDCFRSDYSGSEDKTYVELTFLHKNKTYCVVRNPLYMRNKLKGGGLTQEKAGATMTFPDGSIISGYHPVTEAIISLLGIDWKQYKQIAMIAQGEFLQLLTADSTERGLIFRKVFGTQVYDEVQKKLKMNANTLRNQCEDLDKSILQFLEGIACDAENVHYKAIMDWKEVKDIHQISKIMEILALLLEADKQRYKSEHKNSELLQAKINEKSVEHTNAIRDNQMLFQLKNAELDYETLLLSKQEMTEKQTFIKAARNALYTVKPSEDIYLRSKSEYIKLCEDITHQTEVIEKSEESLSYFRLMWKEKEADEPKINELMVNIRRQEEELKKYQLVVALESEKTTLYEKKLQLEHYNNKLRHDKEQFITEQDKKKKELEHYQNPERDILDCRNKIVAQDALRSRLNRLIEDIESLFKEEQNLHKLQEIFKKAEENYQIQHNHYLKAEALFYREQAGILAETLKEGIPCPVCGSVQHPQIAEKTNGAPSEDQLKNRKNTLDALQQKFITTGNQCGNQKTVVEMLKKQLQVSVTDLLNNEEEMQPENLYRTVKDKLEKENSILLELKNTEKKLETICNLKNECSTRLLKLSEELSNLENSLSNTNEEILQIANQLHLTEGKLVTISSDLQFTTMEEANKALDADKKECIKLQESLQKAKTDLQNCEVLLSNQNAVLEDNRKKLNKKKTELKQEEETLKERLIQNGFESLNEYHKCLISEAELESLINTIEIYQKSCDNSKLQIAQLKRDTLHIVKKDLSEIEEQQRELEKQKAESDEHMQKIYSRIKINSDTLYKANEIYKQQEDVRAEFLVVSNLSKTANGELSGKAKIAFEQYVQAFYFNSVIREANKRLYKMSNNQFILRRKEDPSNLRSATGLELEVMDFYTGKPRSIKSLSGGESFKAALSLALGLSDVIQSFAGGIEVDAMFIDEGFGSLDSNSLEQAIETLSVLTMGNRFIGIISHVSELKERIDKKISIEKGMDGSRLSLIK